MSHDLLTQLAEYGTYCEERQGSVSPDAVIGDLARLPEPTPTSSIDSRRRWLVAVGAAALTLLLVGGMAWIARSNPPIEPADKPAVTTVPPDEQLGTVGALGPGGWSVAATFTDGTVSEGLLRGTVEELRSWPGVLEVALVRDASEWLALTGLDAVVCGDGSTEPPCGVGLVALVATPQMGLTQVRLESELGMVAIKATDVPVAFVDGYVAAVRRWPAADLRFDVSSLGTEVPLEGPDGADSGNLCLVADCLVSVRVSEDVIVAQAGLLRHENGDGSFEVEILGENGHGGRGFETTHFLIDGSGRGGVLTIDANAGDRALYGLAGLPLDAAAVTIQLADGTSVWQRPVGGMVLFVDRPGTAVGESAWPAYRFTVLDADGGEIIHIENTSDGPTVTDLRVDRVKAGELQNTDIDAIGPVDVAGMTLTWTQVQWGEGEGPFVRDLVSTSSGFLGTDRQGRLWRSSDSTGWDLASVDLEDVSLADGQTHVLVSGRRDDGSVALLRSEDGETWTEIDSSTLGAEAFRVGATTPSGLTWFQPRSADGSSAGVISVIEGDRVTEIHSPPWGPIALRGAPEIVEVEGTVAAFQYGFNEPLSSFAWQYVGNGRWSEAVQIPFSSAQVRVGDTVLMFDHTNATCCGDPIPGLSQWPLLASNDGINWIEIDTRTAQDVHALQINAGASFWVYGPHGGGGNDIDTESATTLWLSRDGRSWEPVDTSFAAPSFVVIVGDVIILADRSGAYDGTGTYWIGTVREQ